MDEYIYLQSVHKDFHGVLSYIMKFIRKNYGEKHLEEFFTNLTPYIYSPLIKRIKKRV